MLYCLVHNEFSVNVWWMAEWIHLHLLSTTTPFWNTRMGRYFHKIYNEKIRFTSLTCHLLLTVLKLFSCSLALTHIWGRKMPPWRWLLLGEMWLASLLEEKGGAPVGGRTTHNQQQSEIFIPVSSLTTPTSRMSSSLAVISETVIIKHVNNPENLGFLMKNAVSVHCL